MNKQEKDEIHHTVIIVPELPKLDYIYSSDEPKAKLTAHGIVNVLNRDNPVTILFDKQLYAVNRDKGCFLLAKINSKRLLKTVLNT